MNNLINENICLYFFGSNIKSYIFKKQNKSLTEKKKCPQDKINVHKKKFHIKMLICPLEKINVHKKKNICGHLFSMTNKEV